MYRHFFKQIFDLLLSFIGLLIASPVFLLVTIMLTFANKGKPFFFQPRPGKNEKIFRIVKFKTMNDKRDQAGNLLPDAQRLTPIGKFVRKTSLDEIPQLINVLKGDMSLIGPRPLKVHNLLLYTKEQARRHEVRPGITGWAQVNGRNKLKLSKKFQYDVWYVDHLSLLLDFRIFIMTIKNIILKKNIGEGDATMEEVDDLHFMDRLNEIKEKQIK